MQKKLEGNWLEQWLLVSNRIYCCEQRLRDDCVPRFLQEDQLVRYYMDCAEELAQARFYYLVFMEELAKCHGFKSARIVQDCIIGEKDD